MEQKPYSALDNLIFILKKALANDKWLFVNAVAYAVLQVLLSLAELYIPKWILDVLLGQRERDTLIWLFGAFILAGFAALFSQMLRSRAFSRIIELRFKLVEDHQTACLTTDYEIMETVEFEEKVFASYRAVSNNTWGIEGILHRLYLWPGLLASLAVSTYALVQINFYLFLPALLSALASFFVGNRAAKLKARDKAADVRVSRKSKYLRNSMKSRTMALDVRLPLVRALLWQRYGLLREELKTLGKRQSCRTQGAEFYVSLIDCLKTAAVYAFLIFRTYSGAITISVFSLCVGAMEDFADCFGALLKDIRFIQDQNLDVNEFRWFTQNICGDFTEDGTVIDHIDEIVFEQVSYQYANSPTYAVKDVNVTIRRSSKIAVVGENGAGKTTFVKLLLGLYTPTSGRILVNGMDMATINKSSFYKCMASVFQDFHILAFSIAENISLSEDKACAGRVEQILEQVGLLSRIQKLPKAIDTPASHAIEDEGIELSGGEGQRVALARALYTGASWYVLDEPSAALDPLAERNLYAMFAQTMEGRTMLFVSHRLASTTLCDEILFFSRGVIAERGSHEELMGLGGGYAALYEAQARFYREGQTATERD